MKDKFKAGDLVLFSDDVYFRLFVVTSSFRIYLNETWGGLEGWDYQDLIGGDKEAYDESWGYFFTTDSNMAEYGTVINNKLIKILYGLL